MKGIRLKKCYIAGKIGDLPIEEFTRNFETAKDEVNELGYYPISPLELPHAHGKTWIEYMKEDLIALLDCDAVYCLRNWRDSPGARIEIQTALSLGLTVHHQQMKPKPDFKIN